MKKVCLLLCSALLMWVTAFAANPAVIKKTYQYARKNGQALLLDKYDIPSNDMNRPCLIFMFGGGFVNGNRDADKYMPFFQHLAEKGIVVVSIDYRLGLKDMVTKKNLSGEEWGMALVNTLDMAVEDLFDATIYVRKQAREWGIDPDGIIACGSSAGAITVLQAEYELCRSTNRRPPLPAGFNYAGVISFAGAVFVRDTAFVMAERPCPIQLFHGDADNRVPYGALTYSGLGFYGSKPIADLLDSYNIPNYFVTYANFDHEIATLPMRDNWYEIDFFIDRMVIGGQPLRVNTTFTQLDKPLLEKDFTLEEFIRANTTGY